PAQARTPLPAARDGFVGRERELGQLREALSTRAIVSITGPGGVGKSRLALESLHRARASTDRKVSWVDLSDARSAADVIAAVAASIGVPLDSRAASASLGRAIAASGPLLICLDDGDNVAEELARLSSEWVDACPELVLLLTCRHPVGVLGDRQIRLRPLDVPEDDKLAGALVSDAIALLLRRTQDRAGDLRLDAGNAEALCRIVRAVDGLPLAIELVAAQAAHLPLSTLADELETMGVVAEAFEVGRPTRHGSLSTTFRWSFQHLDSVSRDVLGQLTVFDGGFTLPAADTIVDARVPVVPEIHRLVTQSWVRRRPGARFELLSLVRRFVEAETEDSALQAARARHVRHFSGSSEWPPEELRNLVSACRRHLDAGHVDPTLLQTTWFMLRRRGRYAMGLQISTLALELCRDPVSVVHVSRMVGECHVLMGRVEQGREMYDRALETARSLDDPVLLGKALASRAFAAWPDERELAYRYLNEAVRLGDAHGDPKGARLARARTARFYFLEGRLHDAKAAYTTLLEERPEVRDAIVAVNLGAIHAQLGERAEAERWFETSLGWANEVGADTTRVYIMGNLGLLAAEDGERELAETRFRAAIDMANRTGERRHAGWCQGMLGMMYLDDGDVDEAHEVLRESLDCLRVWGKAQDVAFSLARLAEVALAEDRFDSAERHLDDAHRQFRSECPSATRVDLLVVDARRRLALDDVEAASSSLRVARALVSSENLVLGSRIARRLTEAERALGQRS
ncbi:MAG: tetratricopeptide repeat protein, partial [Myxococcota bacterium]